MTASNDKKPAARKRIAPPKGTRDLYPEDTLRTRYIQKAWRDTSIRCGFDEIEGPTFEQAELYAVKSGEGILGELFQAFSGKSEEEIAEVRETGRAPFALRPEFTPTLARMYAAKAGSLPKPCKWFTAGPYFRAERPQRGRLREFLQWNCDVIGDDGTPGARAGAEVDCIEICLILLDAVGLDHRLGGSAGVRFNDRATATALFTECGVPATSIGRAFAFIDKAERFTDAQRQHEASTVNLDMGAYLDATMLVQSQFNRGTLHDTLRTGEQIREWLLADESHNDPMDELIRRAGFKSILPVIDELVNAGIHQSTRLDPFIVRGLAYYTGMVFEVIAEGERAVAGGGRYDNLIELMGGPPTPAVGFAMGDVVLGLLLEDKDLMPEGPALMDALSAPPASVRPEAFVLPNGDDDNEPLARRLVADLRRGVESKHYLDLGTDAKPWNPARYDAASDGVRPLHARQTYKSTRNLKKLLADADKQYAKFALVIHSADEVQLKNLDTGNELTPKDVPGMNDQNAEFCVRPDAPNYVGRAITALC